MKYTILALTFILSACDSGISWRVKRLDVNTIIVVDNVKNGFKVGDTVRYDGTKIVLLEEIKKK